MSFDLVEENAMRLAQDIQVVAADEYPTLSDELQQVCNAPGDFKTAFHLDCVSRANVVAFDPAHRMDHDQSVSHRRRRA